MYYFDLYDADKVLITFENFETVDVPIKCIESLGYKPSPYNDFEYDEAVYCTDILLNQEIYRSPDIYDRLCRWRDIAWIDVVKNDNTIAEWPVPWDDDPLYEDENMLQTNVKHNEGLAIYITDCEEKIS